MQLFWGIAWPYVYPWPQRPKGLIEEAFDELAKRWRIFNILMKMVLIYVMRFIQVRIFMMVTFEMFLEK